MKYCYWWFVIVVFCSYSYHTFLNIFYDMLFQIPTICLNIWGLAYSDKMRSVPFNEQTISNQADDFVRWEILFSITAAVSVCINDINDKLLDLLLSYLYWNCVITVQYHFELDCILIKFEFILIKSTLRINVPEKQYRSLFNKNASL